MTAEFPWALLGEMLLAWLCVSVFVLTPGVFGVTWLAWKLGWLGEGESFWCAKEPLVTFTSHNTGTTIIEFKR